MRERIGTRQLADVRGFYDGIYRSGEYGDGPELYRLVLERLELTDSEPVLDVACGAGSFLEILGARGVPAIGVELSEEALRRAQRRAPEALLAVADGAALPFADDSFSALVCLGSLEHFLDPAAGARELARVLAPKGRAVVMLPNSYYSGDIWRVIRTGHGPNHHQIVDRFATLGEWRELLEGAGLLVLRVDRYDKGKLWKRLLPFNLAYHFVFTCGVASQS